MSRPKLLERFDGYVTGISPDGLYVVGRMEQMEVPASALPKPFTRRMREGSYATALIYENRVEFRLRRFRLSAREIRQAHGEARMLMKWLKAAPPQHRNPR